MQSSHDILLSKLTPQEKYKFFNFKLSTNRLFWANFGISSFLLFTSFKALKITQKKSSLNLLIGINFIGIPLLHYLLIQKQKEQFEHKMRMKYVILEE